MSCSPHCFPWHQGRDALGGVISDGSPHVLVEVVGDACLAVPELSAHDLDVKTSL